MNETKDEMIRARIDKKLYKQLKEYANRHDNGVVSETARRALRMLLQELEKTEK